MFYIKRITLVTGNGLQSYIEFDAGLNIIYGESNTGKSLIVDCMAFTTKGEMLTAFSDEMFLAFVENITVETRERIVFHLKSGLNLTERLVM